jgi:hypothetical protein
LGSVALRIFRAGALVLFAVKELQFMRVHRAPPPDA